MIRVYDYWGRVLELELELQLRDWSSWLASGEKS